MDGNDAEGAAVVAALGNFQIGVVLGRQAQALRRHEVKLGIMHRRQGVVNGAHHRLILMRARDRQNAGVGRANGISLDPVAAGDNHPPIFLHGLADGRKAFRLGTVKKAAGIDQHHIGIGIAGCYEIALGPKLGENALGIDQRLGATQRNEANFGDMCVHGGGV